MTLNEFFKWLMTQPIETMIVALRYKDSWDEKWTYSNEILEIDFSVDGFYIWLNDWNEGQSDVEVLGCIPLSDVIVAPFKPILDAEDKNGGMNADDLISRQAAIEVLRNRWLKTRNYEGIGEDIAEECEIYLKTLPSAQPTVDAVPVIRCKDCKYYEEQDETIGTCLLTESGAHVKGYCSWAEVKEE